VGWTGSWSAAPAPPGTDGLPGRGLRDQTLREVVHTTLGGDQVRIRLTNVFGAGPLTVDDVAVATRGAGASVVPGTSRPVTFQERPRAVIPAGAEMLSDPVPLRVAAEQDLAVSLYARGATGPMTWHATALTTSYYSGGGDHTRDTGGAAFSSTTASWFLLDGLDVRAPGRTMAVVAFGDSITDGSGSTPDAGRSYPRDLARRLHGSRWGGGVSVLNEGLAGTRLLTDAGTAGVRAPARFPRDALAQAGVGAVVFQEGINDIGQDLGPDGGPLTASQILATLSGLIASAHAHGLRIIGGTLTPIGGSLFSAARQESLRSAVNTWIRTSGAFDAVVDFDRAVRDPDNPLRILPRFDSGDHLHPNDAGYEAMADAIDPRSLWQ
jgi:lysophospholipase L1-like esterase